MYQTPLDERWDTDLCEPTPDIVEPDANDVVPLEGTTTQMVRGAVAQKVTVSETQVFEQVSLGVLCSARICEWFYERDVDLRVSANEALVSLADDVCLASPARGQRQMREQEMILA